MAGTSVKERRSSLQDMKDEQRLDALAEEDESYEEYVPLKERRRREAERRAGTLGKNKRDRERLLQEQER